jgi:hypothetical protein
MTGRRGLFVLTAIFVALLGGLVFWSRAHLDGVAIQRTLDQADSDAAAAKAAADAAAISAGEAAEAARKAQNALPGSS